MQWVRVADLQNEGMKGCFPGFATRKAAASTDVVAVKGELQTMDGKKEREAVLTEMGHEAERKGGRALLVVRDGRVETKKAGEGPRGKDE